MLKVKAQQHFWSLLLANQISGIYLLSQRKLFIIFRAQLQRNYDWKRV